METTIQAQQLTSVREVKKVKTEVQAKSLSDFWEKVELNRFGIAPMLLGIIAIFGAFVGAIGIEQSTIKLAFVAGPTMFALAMNMAVTPMRTIVISSIVALIVDLLVIII